MSVLNATILRVDTPGTPDAGGDASFTNGSSVAVRCTMYAVLSTDRVKLGARINDATATLLVRKIALPGGLAIEKDDRVLAQLDTEPQKTYRVVWKQPWIKGALSSHQLFLQEIA